jgi:hypothetical protein
MRALSRRAAAFTQAEVSRAIRAAEKAGGNKWAIESWRLLLFRRELAEHRGTQNRNFCRIPLKRLTIGIPLGSANNFNDLASVAPHPVQDLSNRRVWICEDARGPAATTNQRSRYS